MGVDGILGLSPDTSSSSGPSFIKSLKDNDLIDEPMVSFYL